MAAFDQLKLLIWKNFILQKRRPIATAVELILPILFSCLLIVIRTQIDITKNPNITQWKLVLLLFLYLIQLLNLT